MKARGSCTAAAREAHAKTSSTSALIANDACIKVRLCNVGIIALRYGFRPAQPEKVLHDRYHNHSVSGAGKSDATRKSRKFDLNQRELGQGANYSQLAGLLAGAFLSGGCHGLNWYRSRLTPRRSTARPTSPAGGTPSGAVLLFSRQQIYLLRRRAEVAAAGAERTGIRLPRLQPALAGACCRKHSLIDERYRHRDVCPLGRAVPDE